MPIPLMEQTSGALETVPFCTPTEQTTLAKQEPYYVDVRENRELLLASYSICVTPISMPDRFRHLPLHEMVAFLLDYLQSPTRAVKEELAQYYVMLETKGPSVFLFLCIAHAHAGLHEYQTALEVLDRGTRLFPASSWLTKKAEHVRSLM